MSFLEQAKTYINEKTLQAFDACRADTASVRAAAIGKSMKDWRVQNIALGAACAGGAILPGPAALAALAIEIPALLNVFSRAALGVGWIKRGHVTQADYDNILGVWAGTVSLDETLRKSVQTQAALAIAAVAPKVAGALSTTALTTALTVVAAKKGTSAAATYMAAKKFASMIISRLPARMVPIVGLGVAAALNAWFVNSIINAAERYYDFLGPDGLPVLEALPAPNAPARRA